MCTGILGKRGNSLLQDKAFQWFPIFRKIITNYYLVYWKFKPLTPSWVIKVYSSSLGMNSQISKVTLSKGTQKQTLLPGVGVWSYPLVFGRPIHSSTFLWPPSHNGTLSGHRRQLNERLPRILCAA